MNRPGEKTLGASPLEFSAPVYLVGHAILPLSSTVHGLGFATSGSYSGLFDVFVLKPCLTIVLAGMRMASAAGNG